MLNELSLVHETRICSYQKFNFLGNKVLTSTLFLRVDHEFNASNNPVGHVDLDQFINLLRKSAIKVLAHSDNPAFT